MKISWGGKTAQRRKRAILRTKVRWDALGLQDPAQAASTLSIDDVRRQIISASNHGLSADSLSRTRAKATHSKPRSKTSDPSRKQDAGSK
ncbi:MAG: hypothetical protein AB7P24_03045 [Nitrospira sp.]